MARCVSRLFILNGTSDDVERVGGDEVTGRAGAGLAREARRSFPYIFYVRVLLIYKLVQIQNIQRVKQELFLGSTESPNKTHCCGEFMSFCR